MNRRRFLKNSAGIFVPSLLIPRAIVAQGFQPTDVAFAGQSPPPAASGPSYLVSEGFEGGTVPSGWASVGAGLNWGYTGVVLEGTKSLLVSGVNGKASVTYTAQSEVWFYCLLQVVAMPALINTITICSADLGTNYCIFRIDTSLVMHLYVNGGGNQAVGSTLSTGVTYSIWIHYKAGSGSNAVGEVWYATTTTKPASPDMSVTNGISTGSAAGIHADTDTGDSIVLDHFRVSSAAIGSAPA